MSSDKDQPGPSLATRFELTDRNVFIDGKVFPFYVGEELTVTLLGDGMFAITLSIPVDTAPRTED